MANAPNVPKGKAVQNVTFPLMSFPSREDLYPWSPSCLRSSSVPWNRSFFCLVDFLRALLVILDRTIGSIWPSPAILEAESFSYVTHNMKSTVRCEEAWMQPGRLLSWDNIVSIERFAREGGRRKGILGRWHQAKQWRCDMRLLDSCREFLLSCFPLSSKFWGLAIPSCPESLRNIPFFELENQNLH